MEGFRGFGSGESDSVGEPSLGIIGIFGILGFRLLEELSV